MARPTLAAYAVVDHGNEATKKTKWREIGVVFAHKDGKGFDVLLDAVPVNGRVTLRAVQDRDGTGDVSFTA